jgi:hypothetical protein
MSILRNSPRGPKSPMTKTARKKLTKSPPNIQQKRDPLCTSSKSNEEKPSTHLCWGGSSGEIYPKILEIPYLEFAILLQRKTSVKYPTHSHSSESALSRKSFQLVCSSAHIAINTDRGDLVSVSDRVISNSKSQSIISCSKYPRRPSDKESHISQ